LITIAIRGNVKETRKYFKYRKIEYIRRFYRNGETLITLKISENGDVLAIERS
jgi:hypothetical protein